MANRLASTTSAYLQKHANNPVDWWSWTDEAFAEAKKRDLPLFISIGYFSCHWCSVMERESFEDKATAEFLNSNFICIKVDRDEMPDIDRIYQRYYNTLTGEAGGWPLSIYAFPDGIPFYIATYLPRKFSLRSRTFMSLNREIAESWQNERDPLFDISSGLSRNLDSSNKVVLSGSKSLSDNIFVAELSALQERMDWKYGGFSGEPKFPRFSTLEFLLKEGMRRDSDTLKQFVKSTIIKMSNGGIYDRLNGGIARYSVDERWDIPHFEKMLYDQAGWLRLLANLYAVDLEETFLSLIEFQLFFLREWMTSEDGLFYSSVDAETGGEEGAFYIFTYEEIRSVLDLEYNGKRVQIGPLSVLFDNRFQKNSLDFEIFSQRYGIKRRGNIRDPNITIKAGNVLKATKTVDQVLKQLDIEIKGYYESINRSTQLLREYQAKREKPAIDTKVITAWNALVITSLLTAYEKTRLPAASEMATRALDRLLQSVYVDSA
ncbi:MAG: thioredoxin domain-containing protein, partial [Candidatus Kariarchaeaceae archaeon]